jgi:hypothetical protein
VRVASERRTRLLRLARSSSGILISTYLPLMPSNAFSALPYICFGADGAGGVPFRRLVIVSAKEGHVLGK